MSELVYQQQHSHLFLLDFDRTRELAALEAIVVVVVAADVRQCGALAIFARMLCPQL